MPMAMVSVEKEKLYVGKKIMFSPKWTNFVSFSLFLYLICLFKIKDKLKWTKENGNRQIKVSKINEYAQT